MHLTGLGKALLAAYPEDKVREITGGGKLEVRTSNSIGEYRNLLAHLQDIRKAGYSFDNGEDSELICCIAAPIYDRTGKAAAAISVAMFAAKLTKEKKQQISSLVIKTALDISNRLGYPWDKLYK